MTGSVVIGQVNQGLLCQLSAQSWGGTQREHTPSQHLPTWGSPRCQGKSLPPAQGMRESCLCHQGKKTQLMVTQALHSRLQEPSSFLLEASNILTQLCDTQVPSPHNRA